MASASASPELSQPTTLLAHPTSAPAELARHATLSASTFSTSKSSSISVGAAYKLSSDARSLRRLKGTLPILVAGHALNLVNPQTQTPIQSFTLSSAETASSAPLTLLRSLDGGRSLRTTYIGIESHTRAKTGRGAVTATHQLWAFVEELSAKGKESSVEAQVKKEVLSLSKPVRLIHALADGRLVITHPNDSLSVVASPPISHDDDASVQSATTALQVVAEVNGTHQQSQQRSHFYVNVLDASSAKSLVSGSSKIEEAALVGLRVAVTSDKNVGGNSTNADYDATSKKKKRSKRSKKDASSKAGVNDVDDDDLPSIGAASGPLALELTAFVKSFDGASDSAIDTVKLGNIKIPGINSARHIQDVQLHPEGRLVLLGNDGHLTSMTLSTSTSSEPVLSNINTSILPAFALPSNARPSSSSTASPSCCLLLSRDHALVVGVTQATPATADKERVAALIVDLELNAVLRQIDFAVPFVPSSAAGSSPGLLHRMTSISASRIAGSTTIITLGPPTSTPQIRESSANAEALTQLQQRRMCVLAMPFVVPEASVLRDALGKGELTARWIRNSDATAAANGEASSESDASRSELLEQIKKIAQGNGKAQSKNAEINAAVSEWMEATTADGRMLETLTAPEADSRFYNDLLNLLLPALSPRTTGAHTAGFFPRAALLTLLKDPRVHPSVFASLRPSTTSTASSTRNNSLQTNGAGLSEFWSRLGAHNDAQLIRAALKRMPDIGENTVVSLLISALRGLVQSRQSGKADAGSHMALLRHLVQLRVSRPALRSALKAQLRDDVDQVMALLQICNAWISQTIQLPFNADTSSDAADDFDDSNGKAPNADAVMALANDVLDTFFPLLLATPRSHSTVQSLSSTISRYLQLLSTLRLLNAPLSAFAKLQQENNLLAASESKEKKTMLAASGAMASAGNAKVNASSKADAAARAEMGGGLGIRLGTQGEAKTRRLQLLEQSMLVGAYSFERLEI